MSTKRTFEAIAKAIAVRREAAGHYTEETAATLQGELDDLASDLADALAGTNKAFDRQRFLTAAGVREDPAICEPGDGHPWGEQQEQVDWLESRYDYGDWE